MIASDIHAAALKYAALGWRIVPGHLPGPTGCSCYNAACGSPGKHPNHSKWTDAIGSSEVFTNGVLHNIGIIPGAVSGIVVIDEDAGGGEARAAWGWISLGRNRR